MLHLQPLYLMLHMQLLIICNATTAIIHMLHMQLLYLMLHVQLLFCNSTPATVIFNVAHAIVIL